MVTGCRRPSTNIGHARSAAAAVVSDGQVPPLAAGERLLGHDLDRAAAPLVNQVDPRLRLVPDDLEAAGVGRRAHLRDTQPVGEESGLIQMASENGFVRSSGGPLSNSTYCVASNTAAWPRTPGANSNLPIVFAL